MGLWRSALKTKLMPNVTEGIRNDTRANGSRSNTVDSFKYLGSIVMDDGSKVEVLFRIADFIFMSYFEQ